MRIIQNANMVALRSFPIIVISLLIMLSIATYSAWAADPSGIPDRDYTIWGTAYVDDVALTRYDTGYTISLRLDGGAQDLASYTMGSESVNEDWYALRIPMSIGAMSSESAQTGNTAYIYINDLLIAEAYLEPAHQLVSLPIIIGNPAETIRMDIYHVIDSDPPVANDLVITPGDPKTTDDLAGSYDYYDAKSPESGLTEIRWYKYSQLQVAYDNVLIVSFSDTAKEQTWYFTVRPHDGYQFGALQTSDPVIVGNSRPVASDPLISPVLPFTEDDLVVNYDYADPDGDPESGTTIRWYKNDNMQSAYNDERIIPSSGTVKGQQWRFTVRPGDGTELGPYKTSPTVIISNTPPVADAGGPYQDLPGEEVIFDGSGSYDADDDPLVTYSWDFGDDSAGIGNNPSHLYMEPGLYIVTLIVNDGTVDSAPSITTAYIDDDPDGIPSDPFSLAMDWNLISIPREPSDTSIDSVLFSIQGKYDSISTYDATTRVWLKHTVGGPLFINTLSEVTSGAAYWIKMNQAGVLVVQGTQPVTAIWLEKGWNLAGYNLQTSRAIEDCMFSIDGRYNSVYTYDSDERKWFRYVPDGPPSLNDLEFMQPGKGYLIDAKERCVWDVGL